MRNGLHVLECSQENEMKQADIGLGPGPNAQAAKVAQVGKLPTDPKARKGLPIATGCLDYFPRALAEVAKVSVAGNNQHNPGKPLHWDKSKSTDHADCIARHLLERGTRDEDGQLHSAKLAWRALANLEMELTSAETSSEASR
jgi:hypothetical protein